MAVPFATGFNDIFHGYAATSSRQIAFQRAREPWSTAIRYAVSWTDVQQWGPSSFNWSNPPAGWDYEAARSEANSRDLRTLPIVVGCPTGWIPRSGRAACRPEWTPADHNNDWQIIWYPNTPEYWNHYANFCVETLKYFDNCQRIDAVEVWNEPNLPGYVAQIGNPYAFSGMLAAVIAKVGAANANGSFSHPMTVVSGGLYMDYQAGSWKNYLDVFKNQAAPFAVGIHPYDTRNHNGLGSDAAADAVVARVADLYEQAAGRTSMNLWVTETGASSRQPFNSGGQNRALRKLAGAGQFFSTRARCKAVLLHRLYPNDDPGVEGPNTQFHKFSLVNKDASWSQKEAWWMLAGEWAP